MGANAPALSTRAARYLHALRTKGPLQLLSERYERHVNQRLLRRGVYPRIHRMQIRALGLENVLRRRRLASQAPRTPGRVYVVICIDTEGPNAITVNSTWDAVETEVRAVMAPELRQRYSDALGRPFTLEWFVVDWIGNGPNPRKLQAGYHAILDRYRELLKLAGAAGFEDMIHWHYHHAPPGRIDGQCPDWFACRRHEDVLCRRLLERAHWPAVYRAGNTWENNDASNWLERWFPFDLSNRGPYKNVHYDWSRAPRHWTFYHPSRSDYQRSGDQRRIMGRSLDIEKGFFCAEEVEQAFLDAAEGRDSYVSFYTHDFNEMTRYIAAGVETIRQVATRYPKVVWLHSGVLELFRKFRNLEVPDALKLRGSLVDGVVTVQTSHPIFGEPWLAVEWPGRIERCDMLRTDASTWSASLPGGERPLRVGVAASDTTGQTQVLQI